MDDRCELHLNMRKGLGENLLAPALSSSINNKGCENPK
jgi:hypothetical protein